MVFHRCEYAHGFSRHPIDGNVFHTYDIRSAVHYDESIDVDSKQTQLKTFCCNQSICMDVRPCGICECDHLNRDEW